MDMDAETGKFKLLLFIVLVFLVSTFASCNELKFATSGKTTEGTLTGVHEKYTRHGTVREVTYDYRNAANEIWHGQQVVSDDFDATQGRKVQIEFIGDGSRLAGSRNWLALTIFFASLIAILVGGVMFWLHVRAAIRPSGSYKRR